MADTDTDTDTARVTDFTASSDAVGQSDSPLLDNDMTLVPEEDVSLTLGSDSLLILDTKTTHAIALYNVLDATCSPQGLRITYAKPASKEDVAVAYLDYSVEAREQPKVEGWVGRLLSLAYGEAQRHKRLKVLISPASGKGTIKSLYTRYAEPILTAARCHIDQEVTQYSGHAREIAAQIDVDSYDAIVCCSGDGLPYEVFNGLAQKPNARQALEKIAVAMIPGGSGNAMAWNLCGTGSVSVAALAIVKGLRTPFDLVSVTQGNTRTLSFLSQSFGIVAEADLGTDDIRWMGAHRFTYGFLKRLLRNTVWPCEVAVKTEIADKQAIKDHYRAYAARGPSLKRESNDLAALGDDSEEGLPPLRYGTVQDKLPPDWEVIPGEQMGNFYAGKMAIMTKDTNFFPASLPHDGLMDLVTIDGTVSRLTSLQMMTSVASGEFFDMPDVHVRKVSAYRLSPRDKEGYISIDGERVPFEPLQAEVHKGLGTVLSKSGHLYEVDGPK
ncbi:hypothetical protein ASPZODRAFT_57812 [Penicilliopsis zonata CBS 506.65]|uniref:DAGKc domain-containing protein n=1 Tax=Penicilliopsis zonata CBS 506.65 TaxID=1073090 RepID=A0A1L9SR98_9EURO|nr:hypothetical protein ASPZODRAFT_57812 [Penicilliopsis zonata CBS 506.65]OJJ49735.1 hypothetical protein ASPZODRAFT_57812 [Penicilliopsis zonata CBS 506.65]